MQLDPGFPFSKVVDLSHEFFDGMANIANLPVVSYRLNTISEMKTLSGGRTGYNARLLLIPEHCGTHLDVPAHWQDGAPDVSQIPLERLILPGQLLDLRHKRHGEAITIEDMQKAEEKSGTAIKPNRAVVCWTGVDDVWGTENFNRKRPHFPYETAKWLLDRGMQLFATDLIGMDNPDEWWSPVHDVWLTNGVCMVQQLCNLDALQGHEFFLVVLPMKLRGGTGCPVRAVAFLR